MKNYETLQFEMVQTSKNKHQQQVQNIKHYRTKTNNRHTNCPTTQKNK